jgi:hypothetical protein
MIEECVTVVRTRWIETDWVLKAWAKTAPEGGGYDKCDFTITYDDGETYSGRFDLQRDHMAGSNLLGNHVRLFCETYSGRRRPTHITPERYRALMKQYGEETTSAYCEFLDSYEIGAENGGNHVSL